MSDQVNEVDKEFPRWYYGPDNQSRIFQRGEEVPEGWEDHPSKVKKVVEEAEIVEPKVSKSEAKRIAEQKNDEQKAPETIEVKGDVVPGVTPPESLGGSPDPVVEPQVGEGGASTSSDDSKDPETPMTKEQIYESLLLKDMPELWSLAKELKLDHSGRKPQLADRIAESVFASQEVNEPEKTL